MRNDELAEEYRNTNYVVEVPEGTITFRIGEPSGELDALLDRLDVVDWALITAWNPGSFILPPAENERNNLDLLSRITAMGYDAPFTGRGIADEHDWVPEQSWFIPGMPADEALQLGRFYRQRAVVAGRRGEAPRLVWC